MAFLFLNKYVSLHLSILFELVLFGIRNIFQNNIYIAERDFILSIAYHIIYIFYKRGHLY